ncbi:peptidase M48 family protein [Sphingomonas aracearum]|uniref:Peptidase M48 family protein n=2 Tax=Sphingomonas aracearum TaxID=2283317 RepID=A0A369W0F8_9SPHN|nr:peptidase M48 family protein [Sphingomonas aracearum]
MAAAPAPYSAAEDPQAVIEAVRTGDMRVAAIGFRLATANAALCDIKQPATGGQLATVQQYAPAYRPAARQALGLGRQEVAFEGVVPGSPAAKVSLRAGDAVERISGVALPAPAPAEAPASTAALVALESGIARLPPSAPIRMEVSRGGVSRQVVVQPVPACRSRFELLLSDAFEASANGEMVQIGSRFLDGDDDALAVIVAHELAHNILRHTERLKAAGVNMGLLSELGRSGKLNRRTEDEADELSVALLFNAGYDPMIGARYWRGAGRKIGGGLFRSRTHASPAARADAMERAAAALTGKARPVVPALVATRDQPF